MMLCTLPYIVNIVKGKTKPNIITWLTWTLLIAIAAVALFAAHQPQAALLLTGDALATFAVAIFGLGYGIARLDGFDIGCQIAALIGLGLWLVFNSPMIAVVATIVIDAIGTIPTLRHSWSHPEEETSSTFALGVVATICTLLSLKAYSVSAWLYPLYLLLSNALLVVTIRYGEQLERAKQSV